MWFLLCLVIGNLKTKAVIHAVTEGVNGFAKTDPQHPMFGENAAQEKARNGNGNDSGRSGKKFDAWHFQGVSAINNFKRVLIRVHKLVVVLVNVLPQPSLRA
jgi:hypothetical protein